jgi:hypothetical protein
MRRFITPAAMLVAFVALTGVAKAVKAVEVGEPLRVLLVCDERRTVEEHLALIQADPSYGLVRDRAMEDLATGKCMRFPGPVVVAVEEKGTEVKLVDSDGDLMELTVVRVGGLWTINARIVAKNGG